MKPRRIAAHGVEEALESAPAARLERNRVVLDNGLVILVNENPTSPLVSIVAHVESGQRYEPEAKAGVSYLMGELLDGGTKDRSAQRIASDLEYIGGVLSTTSSGIRIKVRTQDLGRGLQTAADCLRRPIFPADRVAFERDRQLAGIQHDADNPKKIAHTVFDDLVYGAHPYHRPAKGYAETVRRLGRKDVLEYHRKYFVPDNLILVFAGDVKTEEVVRRVEDVFGDWKPAKPEFPPIPAVRRQKNVRRKWHDMKRAQIHVYLGHLGIRRSDPDYYPLYVLDEILGHGAGFTDRISRKLRDEQGLAYSVNASSTEYAGKEPGVFYAYIGTSRENYDKAVEGFLEEIRRVRVEEVTPEELRSAQTYLVHHYVFGFETNSQRANQILLLERYGFDTNHFVEHPRRIAAVTASEILAAAARNLAAEHYSLSVAGPK